MDVFSTIADIAENVAWLSMAVTFLCYLWPDKPAKKRGKDGGGDGFTVHFSASSFASASSRDSNSAPSSSAATVHVRSASGTVRSQTLRISRKEYRKALSRMQRKA